MYYGSLNAEVQDYIKNAVLSCVGDSTEYVRNITGAIIASILVKGGIEAWPGILQQLCAALDDDSNQLIVDGAISTISKIFEDFSREYDPMRPNPILDEALNTAIPKLIGMFSSPVEKFRRLAIHSVNQFLLATPPALISYFDAYVQVK